MTEYFEKTLKDRPQDIPRRELVEQMFTMFPDKFIIIRDNKIRGVGFYVTLSDEKYEFMKMVGITNLDAMQVFLFEVGDNVHFIFLAADGTKTILKGIKQIKKSLNPKTISWYKDNKLYAYKMRRE